LATTSHTPGAPTSPPHLRNDAAVPLGSPRVPALMPLLGPRLRPTRRDPRTDPCRPEVHPPNPDPPHVRARGSGAQPEVFWSPSSRSRDRSLTTSPAAMPSPTVDL